MFDRVYIKTKAKEVLKKYYWLLFVVGLIMLFLSGEIISFKYNLGNNSVNHMQYRGVIDNAQIVIMGMSISMRRLLGFLGVLAFFAFVFSLIFKIFIANPVMVGCYNYFIRASQDRHSLDDLITPFRKYYRNAVVTMLLRDFYVFLWGLLLVIPGIIKSYAYSFVPYLLDDQPNLTYGEVLRKSEEMTRGMKFDLFVLDLSFFGWYLLNIITFNLASLFIKPYVEAAKVQVYLETKIRGYNV